MEVGEEVVGIICCILVWRGPAQFLHKVSICIVIVTAISTPILSHIDGKQYKINTVRMCSNCLSSYLMRIPFVSTPHFRHGSSLYFPSHRSYAATLPFPQQQSRDTPPTYPTNHPFTPINPCPSSPHPLHHAPLSTTQPSPHPYSPPD